MRVVRDRAFYKKAGKARLKSGSEGRARPCLLQKNVKGTVEKRGRVSSATVPLAKKCKRHGRKVWAGVERDRAFCKKASKARSKLRGKGRSRPCLLQKNGKGTVEKCGRGSCATVPFVKKRQRHGRKVRPDGLRDRAFCKKTSKARSKSGSEGRARPCLLQKNVKGTVGKWGRGSSATVPFAKKRQRHGRKVGARVVRDRAFCKKAPKARSKSGGEGRARPCLLQKNVKGTVAK